MSDHENNPLWDRYMATIAAERAAGGEEAVQRRKDEYWEESRRYTQILKEASNAAIAAAPHGMPKIRDRDISVGMGLTSSGLCYVLHTDADLAKAQADGMTDWLAAKTREEFLARGYPPEAIERFRVRYTTHEVILREAGGNYHHYFH